MDFIRIFFSLSLFLILYMLEEEEENHQARSASPVPRPSVRPQPTRDPPQMMRSSKHEGGGGVHGAYRKRSTGCVARS